MNRFSIQRHLRQIKSERGHCAAPRKLAYNLFNNQPGFDIQPGKRFKKSFAFDIGFDVIYMSGFEPQRCLLRQGNGQRKLGAAKVKHIQHKSIRGKIGTAQIAKLLDCKFRQLAVMKQMDLLAQFGLGLR